MQNPYQSGQPFQQTIPEFGNRRYGKLQTPVQAGCVSCFAGVFVLVGIVILLVGLVSFSSEQALHASHATTTGKLGNCSTTTAQGRTGTTTTTTCYVTYTVHGSPYSISTTSDAASGSVIVYYQPSNPSNAEIATDFASSGTSGIWVMLVGGFLALLGVLGVISGIRGFLRTRVSGVRQ